MAQMYKVFIGEVSLAFAKDINTDLRGDIHVLDKLPGPAAVKRFLKQGTRDTLVFPGPKPQEDLNRFIGQFTVIRAAGGFVRSGKGRYLMIFRRGYWDLPKGKSEKKEKPWDAAVREVTEETGVKPTRMIAPMPSTWHVYTIKGEPVVKETRWYAMEVDGQPEPVPETAEDISEAKWVKPKGIRKKLERSYAAIAMLVDNWL